MNKVLFFMLLGGLMISAKANSQIVVVHRAPRVYYRPVVRPVVRRVPPPVPVVVHPVVVRVLPPHRVVYYAGIPYYYAAGVFYIQVENTDTYKVVEAPAGVIVEVLPEGAQQKVIDDEVYYVAEGVYYKVVKVDGSKKYRVVQL
ncbi:DUF6515 family protein [Neptunitalea lumnitzerae]|uniref:DUF1236 domain-containing protein n=1 Tax=Neptunitalea lumnitzerae TaxID=2965509 RepID=A0ABQ5MLQ6_9FLAO|nr:DUF6515 family protein [Neptunitalea sp. Y10]GLB50287.1 hypothetical protein Y10_26550 [Neptunitalea sp. Y10]